MSTLTIRQFQEQVSALLLRHRSLLDVLSKSQQSNACVNRAVAKAITECGCITLNATKQEYSEELSMDDAKKQIQTHVNGQLCEHCTETVMDEIGTNLFYLSSLCNLLDLDLETIIDKEFKKCSTLGLFKLT